MFRACMLEQREIYFGIHIMSCVLPTWWLRTCPEQFV